MKTNLMKALVVKKYGGLDELELREVERPTPKEGEVLVKIAATSINPVDWKLLSGYADRFIPAQFPYIIGWDVAGTVHENGHAARRFDPGESVYGYLRRPVLQHGTFAEYVAVPESYLARAPRTIPLVDSASIPLAGLTAYQALVSIAGLQAGEAVLILGAAGGVGSFATQIVRNLGGRPIAIARQAYAESLRQLGATALVDHTAEGWVEAARAQGATLLLDCVGGATLAQAAVALPEGGRVVSITERKLDNPKVRFSGATVEPHSRQLELLASWADAGQFVTAVARRVGLAEALAALRLSIDGKAPGKTVITMD